MRPPDDYDDVNEFDDTAYGDLDSIRHLIDEAQRKEERFSRRRRRPDKHDLSSNDDFDDYDEDEFDGFSGLDFEHH